MIERLELLIVLYFPLTYSLLYVALGLAGQIMLGVKEREREKERNKERE